MMLRKPFRRKTSPDAYDERYQLPHPRVEFNNVIRLVDAWMETKDHVERIALLDFLLKVLREDIKSDLLSTILYSGEHFEKEIMYVLPSYFYDEFGNKMAAYPDRDVDGKLEVEWVTVNLADDCVWVLPWKKHSLRDSILTLFKNDFAYDKNNHRAYYFTSGVLFHAYRRLLRLQWSAFGNGRGGA